MTYRKRTPEYHPVVKVGTGLAIMGFFVNSCGPLNTSVNNELPSPTGPTTSEVIPTPTEDSHQIDGTAVDGTEIRAAFGGAVGAGGISALSRIESVFNTPNIQKSLNEAGLAPVVGEQTEGGGRIIGQYSVHHDGERVCFPNIPDVLFNPNIASGQDEWLRANELIVSYGSPPDEVRFKGVGAVSLDGLPENIICVNAVVNKVDNPFDSPQGKVLMVLLNRNTGKIYGTLPGIYSAEDDVNFEFETGNVFVNNQRVWFAGEQMVDLASDVDRILGNRGAIELKGPAISAEGMLRNAEQVIEVNTSLVGTVRINGRTQSINYPNINTPITFGLHDSVINREEGSSFLGIESIYLNDHQWDKIAGDGGAERQILADYMYAHYVAWQYDQNGRFLEERENVSFFDYLKQVNDGEIDGGHMMRVRVDQGYLQAYDEQIRILPTDPTVVMFADYKKTSEPYIGGSLPYFEIAFDPIQKTTIVITNITLDKNIVKEVQEGDPELVLERLVGYQSYKAFGVALERMAYPERYQWGYIDSSELPQGEDGRRIWDVYNRLVNVFTPNQNFAFREPPLKNTYDLH